MVAAEARQVHEAKKCLRLSVGTIAGHVSEKFVPKLNRAVGCAHKTSITYPLYWRAVWGVTHSPNTERVPGANRSPGLGHQLLRFGGSLTSKTQLNRVPGLARSPRLGTAQHYLSIHQRGERYIASFAWLNCSASLSCPLQADNRCKARRSSLDGSSVYWCSSQRGLFRVCFAVIPRLHTLRDTS